MEYPDYKTYRTLYSRYFRKDRLDALLKRLPFRKGFFLDLCCGEGRVSLEARKRGANKIVAIDMCSDMIPKSLRAKVDVRTSSVESVLKRWESGLVSVAVCQQSINYWLSRETAEQLHTIMAPGGIFSFNTFVDRPSKTPRTMNYELEGKQYWECSYLLGDMVHHVQICKGIAPHVTAFRWLSENVIRDILAGLFDVQLFREGSSVIYRCEKLS